MSVVAARVPTAPSRDQIMSPLSTFALGSALAVWGACLLVFVAWSWRLVELAPGVATDGPIGTYRAHTLFGSFDASRDSALIILIAATASLGGFVHAATSFVSYAGNRSLMRSWVWWYALRSLIASALAIIGYFAFRGGFLANEATSNDVNVFGVAALAGLSGLFSKQATDKLREVFDTVFRTRPGSGDDQRADKLETAFAVTDVTPRSVAAGSDATPFEMKGTGFAAGITATVGGQDRVVNVADDTTLTVELPKKDLAATGRVVVTLVDASGASTDVSIDVT
jgi:hypothetical protein